MGRWEEVKARDVLGIPENNGRLGREEDLVKDGCTDDATEEREGTSPAKSPAPLIIAKGEEERV